MLTNSPLLIVSLAASVGGVGGCSTATHETSAARMEIPAPLADGPKIFFTEGVGFVRPDRLALLNTDGSPRVLTDADYERFWADVAPLLEEWARDPRLAINPAYMAALLTKESGFEPTATSWTPANGYPQLTYIADADMRQMAREAPEWNWMLEELDAWPRHPLVHRENADKLVTDSLVVAGEITPENEYFFDPRRATRGGVFWIRLLAEVWTEDEFPGRYNTFARERLNGGAPLTESQIFDLVTVSYNRGYTYAYDLIDRFGPDWQEHLDHEPADHLERIRHYTELFQGNG